MNKKDSQPIIKTHACTVRLEILTESDIVKHVNIHCKTDTVGTAVETVEMKTGIQEKISSTRTIVTRSSHHPRSVNKGATYSGFVPEDTKPLSPPCKKQRHNRPRREPSNSRIKSDSFTTKQPSSLPLHCSPRTTVSPATPSPNPGKETSSLKPKIKTPVSSTNKKSASKGIFETQFPPQKE